MQSHTQLPMAHMERSLFVDLSANPKRGLHRLEVVVNISETTLSKRKPPRGPLSVPSRPPGSPEYHMLCFVCLESPVDRAVAFVDIVAAWYYAIGC